MTPKQNVYRVTFHNASLNISETIEIMAPSESEAETKALKNKKPGYRLLSVIKSGAQG